MRKSYTFFVFLLLLFAVTISSNAGDRMVLVERYTSSTCVPCAQNNPIMDAFLSAQDPDKVISIAYHMNWPAPGNDPMYLYNVGDNNGRRSFYGVNAIPQAYMDGIISVDAPYTQSFLQTNFTSRSGIMSPITIVVTDSTFGDSVSVKAKLYCETLLDNPNVTVYISVDEKLIHYASPPGTNGETNFTDVMRRMLPSYFGTAVRLMPGDMVVIEQHYYKDPIWVQNQIMPLVFVQAQSKEILNAASKTANFTLMPNTGYKVVYAGQNQSADYNVSVPVVASGYNSPVTLTASVVPPQSGVTVTFPSGNVISSFPGTVSMHVTSSSSVPAGVYRIVVTGTNGAGKTHSTSVGLLVGKNYVTVGSNRSNPALQFKVDNVTYTSAQFFTWDLSSSHNVAAVSPQTFASTRYVFKNWSDGGDTSHNVNITTTTGAITVNYGAQYKLISSITPANIPATIPVGNLYFDSASTITLSITPTQLTLNGKEWYFQHWTGNGSGSYSGTNPTAPLTMNNVIVENAIWDTIAPFGISNLGTGVPQVYSLHQNYPNPFNPVTKIKFDIPHSGHVTLKLYDVLGNEVGKPVDMELQAGYYVTDFDGSQFASGLYFYKLEAGNFSAVRKMVLVK